MATRKKSSDSPRKTAAKKRAPRKARAESTGIAPAESPCDVHSPPLSDLAARIEREGGALVGAYRDPFGGFPLALAVLPIGRVEATPFQRDLSDVHHKRLAEVIVKTKRFLDPIVVITAPGEGFWTPNGRHRLEAMRRLGARAVTALVVPDREVAWQILALNTERAHNLKERSLEVIRIYRDLLAQGPESRGAA
ncbi:MAG: ParB N-terminal domain-containing protein, partial [Myxococcales bacterium]|nr:ParB N-terminal domain-containing protein [Myxococcales bacterium]